MEFTLLDGRLDLQQNTACVVGLRVFNVGFGVFNVGEL